MSTKTENQQPAEQIMLILSRYEGESWFDAAMRMAKPKKLEKVVAESYNIYMRTNSGEEKAAWAACYDWDVLEVSKL